MTNNDLEKFQDRNFTNDYRNLNLYSMIPRHGTSILDVGSGSGTIFQFLNIYYINIYLSDISKYHVKKLKKFYQNKNVDILLLDAQNFSLSKTVDTISACDIIEHLPDDQKAINNFYNNLKPGGKIFISTAALPSLYGARDKRFGHYKRYTKKELFDMLKTAGFKNIKIKYWNMLGVIPYFISEKIMGTELHAPARFKIDSLLKKIINKILYLFLFIESKINFLPIGLNLIATAQK
jgi:SAM-dependent methyltransferase